jgi:hypothetical protein
MKNLIRTSESDFIDSAILHHKLSVEGDRKGSNAAHRTVSMAWEDIRKSQDRGESFLIKTVKNKDPSVRLWAATFLLPLNESVALKVISEIETGHAPWQVQAMAEVVRDQWKNNKGDTSL